MGELVSRVRPFDKVTVFATYASLGLGTLERAHQAGLPGWDLIVVDEAHRTSGRIGKPWAVVHDNTRIPALRRLHMTATPRLWQLEEDTETAPGAPGELVASMEDSPDSPFGSRCYTLTLSEAIDRGICAPYQVVCLDITDTQLQAAHLLGVEGRSDEVRGARLAALQTALVKASAEEGFRRLVFHHEVKEAEAFAAGLPHVASRLHAADPGLYPRAVWADWLCGEHKPHHRRRVLDEFSQGIVADGTVVEKGFLDSVKVLGEGVDTKTATPSTSPTSAAPCPTSSKPSAGRCECGRVRARSPRSSYPSCSGPARPSTACSPPGRTAAWPSSSRHSEPTTPASSSTSPNPKHAAASEAYRAAAGRVRREHGATKATDSRCRPRPC
ncbi:DEAD/DEAH box helicase family protein [Streptomyces sp. NPDC002386]